MRKLERHMFFDGYSISEDKLKSKERLFDLLKMINELNMLLEGYLTKK